MKQSKGNPEYDVTHSLLSSIEAKAVLRAGVYLTADEVWTLVQYMREQGMLRREPRAPILGDVVSYVFDGAHRMEGTYKVNCEPVARERPIIIMSRAEKDTVLARESKRQYGEMYVPPEYDEEEEDV